MYLIAYVLYYNACAKSLKFIWLSYNVEAHLLLRKNANTWAYASGSLII